MPESRPTIPRFDGAAMPAWLSAIRAVSFDLDHTLWQLDDVIARANHLAEQYLLDAMPQLKDALSPMAMKARRLLIDAEQPALINDKSAYRQALYRDLVLEIGGSEAVADAAYGVFYRERSNLVLYDGAEAMLDALSQRFRLIAITNGNADLGQIGIESLFDEILHASQEHPAKPSPAMYSTALAHAALSPEQMVHVGDQAITDIYGAQRAGVRSIWFNDVAAEWPDGLPNPDIEVRSIAELHRCLLAAGDQSGSVAK